MDEQLGPVLGRIVSGVYILTATNGEAGDDAQETGMLASWVQQCSFDPPAVTVCVNQKRYLNDWMKPGTAVAINIVGESQKQFLSHFGAGFDPGVNAFEGLNVDRSQAGVPVLSDAMGWLAGTVKSSVDGGDHTVYVVELTESVAGDALQNEKPFVHIRKNGLGY